MTQRHPPSSVLSSSRFPVRSNRLSSTSSPAGWATPRSSTSASTVPGATGSTSSTTTTGSTPASTPRWRRASSRRPMSARHLRATSFQAGQGRIWTSWVERESAGVIDKWLDRIAIECRVQFSAMTVRRSVFEELGGFCTEIGSAFDWEMWQRIAAHHRVWFDPRPLVVICRDGTAETDRLAWDGGPDPRSGRRERTRSHAPSPRSRRPAPPTRA